MWRGMVVAIVAAMLIGLGGQSLQAGGETLSGQGVLTYVGPEVCKVRTLVGGWTIRYGCVQRVCVRFPATAWNVCGDVTANKRWQEGRWVLGTYRPGRLLSISP